MRLRANAYSEPQIENPLRDIGRADLEEQASTFHQDHDLISVVDVETLIRGALLAQDGDNIDELPPSEGTAIANEKEVPLRRQPKGLLITMLVTAFAAVIQGWQQSTINSSSLGWQCEPYIEGQLNQHPLSGLAAPLTDAAPWLSASIIGTLISDPLQGTKHGRRPALFISSTFCLAGALWSAHSTQWAHLLASRIILGIGIGAKASISPVFAAEAAPDHLRGQMLMMWQLFDTCGIFVGFVFYWIAKRSWRLLLGSAAIPAFVLMIITFLSPESPRFLIAQGKYVEAFRSLLQLRGSQIQAARDLYLIKSLLDREAEVLEITRPVHMPAPMADQVIAAFQGFFQRLWGLCKVRRNRRACVAAFLVMLTQQLCGINVLAFYSSTLFRRDQDAERDCPKDPMGDSQVAWLNFVDCFGS